MNESVLRRKARIGSLKLPAVLVLILAGVFLFSTISEFSVASKNPEQPQAVAIAQLVDGEIDTSQYVSVTGFAIYDAGYEKTEGSRTVASYFLLLDDQTGHLIVIKASTALVNTRTPGLVTLEGMTHKTPTDLNNFIRSDMPDFEEAGFKATPTLYLVEDEKPADEAGALTKIVILGVIMLLCVLPFFFPSTIFAPRPLEPPMSPLPDGGRDAVKASGRFVQLESMEPTIKVGKRERKFNNTIANIVPLARGNMMVYIHHVFKNKVYGVTVRTSEDDWGVFVTHDNVMDIEPGKLYGWKDRWAIRFCYQGRDKKPATLIVSFDHAGPQTQVVELLKQLDFTVMLAG